MKHGRMREWLANEFGLVFDQLSTTVKICIERLEAQERAGTEPRKPTSKANS